MTKIVVYHRGYGCDTGCCGHTIRVDGRELPDGFSFSHPYGDDHRTYAEGLVREALGDEHVADLDWDNCLIEED